VLLFEEENLKEQAINELEKYIQKLIFQKKEFRKCKMKERIWINQAQVSLENCCAMRNSMKVE
jgi:hypothetical protein